jgi:IclR family mhp operon transcriptional activator
MTRPVQALARGLDTLAFLNRCNGANSNQVAIGVRLSRGTAYRMLETMVGLGLLRKDAERGGYWLTQDVRQLSDGFDDETWITGLARPVMEALGREIGWPVMLTTPLGIQMVLRANTDFKTPLVFSRFPVGHRVPMLGSASGRAWLAFAPDVVRRITLDLIAGSGDSPWREMAASREKVGRLLAAVRRLGIAMAPSPVEAGSTSLATPLLLGDRCLGCLGTRYFTRALPSAAARETLYPKLRDAARRIGEAIGQG